MTCPECGMPPGECYGICPTQDPYHGNQAAEAADHDFNAQYDDMRERYAGEVITDEPDPEDFTDMRHGPVDQYDKAPADDDDVHDSFRPNDDGSVTYISPTGGEHTYDPDDLSDDDSIPF